MCLSSCKIIYMVSYRVSVRLSFTFLIRVHVQRCTALQAPEQVNLILPNKNALTMSLGSSRGAMRRLYICYKPRRALSSQCLRMIASFTLTSLLFAV